MQVTEVDFLRILGKTKDVCVSEIQSDRYPPYISYQVTYSCEAEQRKVRTLLSTALIGADKTLSFSCTVMQMEGTLVNNKSNLPCYVCVFTVHVQLLATVYFGNSYISFVFASLFSAKGRNMPRKLHYISSNLCSEQDFDKFLSKINWPCS